MPLRGQYRAYISPVLKLGGPLKAELSSDSLLSLPLPPTAADGVLTFRTDISRHLIALKLGTSNL